jgi:putative flippase GtrA
MTAESLRESGRRAFLRFSLSGVLFTILGPSLFWLAYPLGPFVAVAVAELLVHAVRFAAFRHLVFPMHRGYRVSLPRYILSALPVSLAGVLTVALFRNRLDRTTLTLTGALIALFVGFLWSRYVYSRPLAKPSKEIQAAQTSSSSRRVL